MKNFLLSCFVLLSTTLFAQCDNYCPEANYPYPGFECASDNTDSPNLKVWVDVLYLKWCQETIAHYLNYQSPPDQWNFLRHDYEPGFSIGALWNSNCSSHPIRAEWSWFYSSATRNGSSGSDGDPSAQGLELIAEGGSFVRLSDSVTLNTFDLSTDLVTTHWDCTQFFFSAGLRYVRLSRDLEEAVEAETLYYEQTLNALGPYLATLAERPLGWTFTLYGSVKAAALAARTKTDLRLKTTQQSKNLIGEFETHDRPVLCIDGDIGVRYPFCTCWFQSVLSIGIQGTYYTNLGGVEKNSFPDGGPFFLFGGTDVTLIGFRAGIQGWF